MLTRAPDAEVSRLWQLAINADPKYGTLWSHAKTSVLQTTRDVLHSATSILARELHEWRHVYAAAIERCEARDVSDAEAADAPEPSVQDSADFVTGFVQRNRRDWHRAD